MCKKCREKGGGEKKKERDKTTKNKCLDEKAQSPNLQKPI